MRNPYVEIRDILNSKQSNAIILTGCISDLFFDSNKYTTIIDYLVNKSKAKSIIHIIYELNGPIKFVNLDDRNALEVEWRSAHKLRPDDNTFSEYLKSASGGPTVALEFLRRLTQCCKNDRKLFIIIESADLLIPNVSDPLNQIAFNRISILYDWFNDLHFLEGNSSVILLSESLNMLNTKITKLPHISVVDVGYPTSEDRKHYLEQLQLTTPFISNIDSDQTAGLTLYHLRQLHLRCKAENRQVTQTEIIEKIEDMFVGQLGNDTVEFKRPKHKINDLIGYTKLKKFLVDELIPRIKNGGKHAISGAAVAGPIGSGKTFIFEAVAAELGMPVITLKNIRSQWFGQTDVKLESLGAILESIDKAVVFVDEADTQFGGVGQDVHDTERRLTGKLQSIMSDSKLKGRIFWLLMTARIDKLSPDMRRPGRAGDLIIPILDPEGDDRLEFIKWIIGNISEANELVASINSKLPEDTSSAAFAYLKSAIAFAVDRLTTSEQIDIQKVIFMTIENYMQPHIVADRREQTLQAILNCTRADLLSEKSFNLRKSHVT